MRLHRPSAQAQAVSAALLTPIFLGVAPIFGKLAIRAGADPFSVAAWRTVVAVGLLWVMYLLFWRKYIFIYPAGLLGCFIIGTINGIGSLFFYGGLGMLDASLAQLLNGMYIVFAVILSHLNGEKISRSLAVRIGLSVIALILLTGFGGQPLNWLGVGMMLGSALMFAGTIVFSQYLLYEIPPTTATLYILSTMAVVVLMAWAAVGTPINLLTMEGVLPPIIVLGVTTALSRLAMFASIQVFGSLRTVIIAIGEIGVALSLAYLVLGDRLTPAQVIGVCLLGVSLLLIRSTDMAPRGINPNALLVHDMANLQFQRIAFHRAFGKAQHDNEFNVMQSLTTMEMQAIQRMMGANNRPVNPLPMPRDLYVDEPTRPTSPFQDASGE
jgi:DME family drug/metabolite transporter